MIFDHRGDFIHRAAQNVGLHVAMQNTSQKGVRACMYILVLGKVYVKDDPDQASHVFVPFRSLSVVRHSIWACRN